MGVIDKIKLLMSRGGQVSDKLRPGSFLLIHTHSLAGLVEPGEFDSPGFLRRQCLIRNNPYE